ncbi:hypothetical protein ABPG74_011117 [Tetrahymena malaccensis]
MKENQENSFFIYKFFMEKFISKAPCSHESCVISSVRGLRNGLYYGAKIRFMHALVMTILFKKGSLKSKVNHIVTLTLEHARNLGTYVFSYKSLVCLLNRLRGVQSPFHSLIAGAICGGLIFGEKSGVNTQIVLYLFSRVIQGSAELLIKKGMLPDWTFYPHLAMICWAVVMYLFEDNESTLQPSLTTSMKYLYKESDHKVKYLTQFLPFTLPSKYSKKFRFRSEDRQRHPSISQQSPNQ